MKKFRVALKNQNDILTLTADSFGVSDSVAYLYNQEGKPVAVFSLTELIAIIEDTAITP